MRFLLRTRIVWCVAILVVFVASSHEGWSDDGPKKRPIRRPRKKIDDDVNDAAEAGSKKRFPWRKVRPKIAEDPEPISSDKSMTIIGQHRFWGRSAAKLYRRPSYGTIAPIRNRPATSQVASSGEYASPPNRRKVRTKKTESENVGESQYDEAPKKILRRKPAPNDDVNSNYDEAPKKLPRRKPATGNENLDYDEAPKRMPRRRPAPTEEELLDPDSAKFDPSYALAKLKKNSVEGDDTPLVRLNRNLRKAEDNEGDAAESTRKVFRYKKADTDIVLESSATADTKKQYFSRHAGILNNDGVPKYVFRAVVVDQNIDDAISESGHLSGQAREERLNHETSNPANPALPDVAGIAARVKQQMASSPFPRDADVVSTSIHPEIALATALKTGANNGKLKPGQFLRLDVISTEGLEIADVEQIVMRAMPKFDRDAALDRVMTRPFESDGQPELEPGTGNRILRKRPTKGGDTFPEELGGENLKLKSVLTPEEVKRVRRNYPEGEFAVIGSIPAQKIAGSHKIDQSMADQYRDDWDAKTAQLKKLNPFRDEFLGEETSAEDPLLFARQEYRDAKLSRTRAVQPPKVESVEPLEPTPARNPWRRLQRVRTIKTNLSPPRQEPMLGETLADLTNRLSRPISTRVPVGEHTYSIPPNLKYNNIQE